MEVEVNTQHIVGCLGACRGRDRSTHPVPAPLTCMDSFSLGICSGRARVRNGNFSTRARLLCSVSLRAYTWW